MPSGRYFTLLTLVRSTGSSRTVKPGTSICTGGGSFTGTSGSPTPAPSGGRFFFKLACLASRYSRTFFALVVGERTVEEQHLGDVAAGEAADLLLAGAVGVEAGTDA